MNWFTLCSAVSKVDSKGRISIPIGFRWKLRLVEGRKVKIVLNKDRLAIIPNSDFARVTNGQSGVSAARSSVKAKGRVRVPTLALRDDK